ncbi:hypothetical protein DMO17_14995 [Aquipseudomonas alcaligenes]|uniref:Uncharacterized protein n=1 Tax=Aquipseudomonas alcaligenes TaxID=43263 RepID=A0A2V4KX31_AQUAC|nr:hypothetical protein [Pseudomonas alcaligenes]PYC22764.1 hypothetical protein DMO17_14995 [Pseudomonas alcaligenes]
MTRQGLGKSLLGFAIVATVLIVAIADVFNATHLFNPDWPGHARFHIGMQFTTLLLVSLFSLAALLQGQVWAAALAPASFWPGLFVAYVIPGTDVYASEALRELGVPINLLLAAVLLVVTVLGVMLQRSGARFPA